MFDDDAPKKKEGFVPRNLDSLSIDELGQYIIDLKGEIQRCEAEIAKKKSVQAAADSLFKS